MILLDEGRQDGRFRFLEETQAMASLIFGALEGECAQWEVAVVSAVEWTSAGGTRRNGILPVAEDPL